MLPRPTSTAPLLLSLCAALAATGPARAHQTGDSSVELSARPTEGEVDLLHRVPARDLAELLRLDRSGEGALDPEEVAAGRGKILQYLRQTTRLGGPGGGCLPARAPTLTLSPDLRHLFWIETYACPAPMIPLQIELRALFETGPYRHRLRAQVGELIEVASLSQAQPSHRLGAAPPTEAPGTPQIDRLSFFLDGGAHILFGPDHLLFLLCLLLVAPRLSSLLWLVTAFTLGHSLSLAAAAFDLLALPPSVVEPLIALSVIWLAVDNLRGAKGARHRPLLTGVFGLIHGFGFAYGLKAQLDLAAGAQAQALLLFNLGVEAGQLGVVALCWPLLRALDPRPWGPRARQLLSALALAAGLFWLVQRLFAG